MNSYYIEGRKCMNLVKVLVINDQKKYQLYFNNSQLQDLAKIIKEPSEYGMVDYLDNDIVESLNTSNKYYISGDDKTKNYQLDILKPLLLNIDKLPMLDSASSIYDKDGNLSYTLVGYLFKEDNGNQELFLYHLKKSNLVKDKGFLALFKKKSGDLHNNKLTVEQIEDGFNLPITDCLASIYKRKDSNEGKQYKVKIYQAYIFDKVFKTSDTQHEYVERNLQKFESTVKIAKDDVISISFKNANLSNLKNVIYSDNHLTRTFANYHDNGRRKIKQIGYDELQKVLDILKNYVKNNADARFESKNIPTLKDGILEVTEDSIPTFAALLDNKVIQRLLNNDIEIPYFKRHPNN